jgi:hypothetical protein
MISASDALEIYGVKARNDEEVLYLEEWLPNFVRITVDGIVPEVDGVRQEEEHNLGVIPIVYFPHHRDGEWYGRSHVPPLIGLTREKNGRMADRGDAAVEYTHQTPFATDVNAVPKQIAIAWNDSGTPVKYATSIGNTKPTAGAKSPLIEYPRMADIPQTVMQYDMDLWNEICIQADQLPHVAHDKSHPGRAHGCLHGHEISRSHHSSYRLKASGRHQGYYSRRLVRETRL